MSKTESKKVCMPSTALTYIREVPSDPVNDPWPCNAGDPLSVDWTGPAVPTTLKCYRMSGSSSGSSSSGSATGTSSSSTETAAPLPFTTLDSTYKRQVSEYEAAMQASITANDASKLPELRTKAEAIQATLNQMIESITFMRRDTPDIQSERTTLLEKLRRIQQDYSAMVTNTDDMETLRRIRQQEGGDARRQLLIYLIAFIFVSTMLLIYMVYTGRKKDTSATTDAMPTMRPAFT